MKPADSYTSFSEINERLESIMHQTSDETLSLDDALTLYEEAVQLGMRVSSLIENTMENAADSAAVPSATSDASANTSSVVVTSDASVAEQNANQAEQEAAAFAVQQEAVFAASASDAAANQARN